MRKSILNLINNLKKSLLQFPEMVNSLEKKDSLFLDKLFIWIKLVEDVLTTYNISNVSELAGLRSKIIAPKFLEERNTTIKKIQWKIAAEVLYEVQAVVLDILIPHEKKAEESRALLRQMLLIVSQTKLIQYDAQKPFDDLVQEIWQFINANEQLRAGAIKLRTDFSITDIQILITEEINLEDF
jgi:hypothetical protein